MIIKGKGLDKMIEGELGKYRFEVGILENKRHYLPYVSDTTYTKGQNSWYNYAGLKLRRQSSFKYKGTLFSVARDMDQAFKWLRRPFMLQSNEDLFNVLYFVVENINGKENRQRIINGIQAVVRNPILRGAYGRNSAKTAKKKGFNKLLMDTGQLFKNIKARLINV